MGESKTEAGKTGNRIEKMEVDRAHVEETLNECGKTEPDVEPPRQEKEGKTKGNLEKGC